MIIAYHILRKKPLGRLWTCIAYTLCLRTKQYNWFFYSDRVRVKFLLCTWVKTQNELWPPSEHQQVGWKVSQFWNKIRIYETGILSSMWCHIQEPIRTAAVDLDTYPVVSVAGFRSVLSCWVVKKKRKCKTYLNKNGPRKVSHSWKGLIQVRAYLWSVEKNENAKHPLTKLGPDMLINTYPNQ